MIAQEIMALISMSLLTNRLKGYSTRHLANFRQYTDEKRLDIYRLKALNVPNRLVAFTWTESVIEINELQLSYAKAKVIDLFQIEAEEEPFW